MLINLGSTTAASVFTASPRPGVTGKLGVANGGTGLTTAPALLVDLEGTSTANIFTEAPRPGVSGKLPVANGGTGANTAAGARTNLGLGSIATKAATDYLPVKYTALDFSSASTTAGIYPLNGAAHPVTNETEYGATIQFGASSTSNNYYAAQLLISSESGATSPAHAYIRRMTSTPSWSIWSTLLDDHNYADYAATKGHTHTMVLAEDTGTSQITLASGQKYKLTAGGSTFIFTMPTSNNYSLPVATSNALGGIKIGYSQSGKNYPIQLANEKAYVNVPWTDTTYSAGTGIEIANTTINNTGVTSIKGNSESNYRNGQVNLTAANIGAVALTGDTMTGNLTLKKFLHPTITGTGTAAVAYNASTSTNGKPALWKFNLSTATPAEGDIITITVPVAGHGNGVFVSTDNGTTYKPVSVSGTSRLTTHFDVGTTITLVYDSDGATNTVYPVAGAAATTNITGGCWRVLNYYDSNTTYSAMTKEEAWTGTATSSRVMRADYLKQILANLGGTNLTLTYDATNGIVLNHDSSGVTATSSVGFYKVKYDAQGHITGTTAVGKSDITSLLGLTPTANTGTVTNVAASGSDGISISGSPITTSGTITIGLNLSTAINGLGEGTSPATKDDYLIAQYAGGGTTTTTYHRRKVSNVVNGTIVKLALGTDTSTTNQWLNKKGEWSTPTAAQVGAATSNHTHTLSIATDTGTSNLNTLTANTTYKLTAGGSSILIKTPQNTTYSVFVKSGANAAAGLVPAPSTTAGTTKYLREDGTWTVPPDTKYTLPTATDSVLGGVKIGTGLSISSGTVSVSSSSGTSTLSWGTEVTLATVGGIAIKAKLPSNPNTDTDTKQNVTLNTSSKAYITGVTTTPTATAQALAGIADTGIYLDTTPGRLTAAEFNATRPMVISAGKNYSNGTTSNIILPAKTSMLYGDGLAISNPTTSNDVGWLRVLGTGESDTVFEIATGDDGASGESIVARQYNTANSVAHSMTLLDKATGNTIVEKMIVNDTAPTVAFNISNAEKAHIVYNSTDESIDFVFA